VTTSSPKIFCIGLPKTGTTSLHHALEILGYRSIHRPKDRLTAQQLRNGDYRLKVLETADAMSDVPVPAVFPQLDRAFPGSKFILTRRDLESWITSCRNAPFNNDPPKPGTIRDFYRAILYGVTAFDEDRFRFVYEDFHRRVETYFAGERAADLLTIDITRGPGWEPLCAFLGHDVPQVEFPRKNAGGTPRRPPSRGRQAMRKVVQLFR
jgi:hypothetical protein